MASGVDMLLKQVLKSLGVTITPEEITKEFDNVRTMIPKFAGEAKEILETTEKRYAEIERSQVDLRQRFLSLVEFLRAYMEIQQTILEKVCQIDMKLAVTDGTIPAGQGSACEVSEEQATKLFEALQNDG